MASAGPAPSGKRAYDAEINLVPFIDLLSCCICFLIITAVWTQIAKIEVRPKPNVQSEDQQDRKQVNLTVHIRSTGYFLSDGSSSIELVKLGDVYPVKDLSEKLNIIHGAYPDIASITVMADSIIPYKELIAVMDLCLKYDLRDIIVSGSEI
jgi:biopolymer transport protein TolR